MKLKLNHHRDLSELKWKKFLSGNHVVMNDLVDNSAFVAISVCLPRIYNALNPFKKV